MVKEWPWLPQETHNCREDTRLRALKLNKNDDKHTDKEISSKENNNVTNKQTDTNLDGRKDDDHTIHSSHNSTQNRKTSARPDCSSRYWRISRKFIFLFFLLSFLPSTATRGIRDNDSGDIRSKNDKARIRITRADDAEQHLNGPNSHPKAPVVSSSIQTEILEKISVNTYTEETNISIETTTETPPIYTETTTETTNIDIESTTEFRDTDTGSDIGLEKMQKGRVKRSITEETIDTDEVINVTEENNCTKDTSIKESIAALTLTMQESLAKLTDTVKTSISSLTDAVKDILNKDSRSIYNIFLFTDGGYHNSSDSNVQTTDSGMNISVTMQTISNSNKTQINTTHVNTTLQLSETTKPPLSAGIPATVKTTVNPVSSVSESVSIKMELVVTTKAPLFQKSTTLLSLEGRVNPDDDLTLEGATDEPVNNKVGEEEVEMVVVGEEAVEMSISSGMQPEVTVQPAVSSSTTPCICPSTTTVTTSTKGSTETTTKTTTGITTISGDCICPGGFLGTTESETSTDLPVSFGTGSRRKRQELEEMEIYVDNFDQKIVKKIPFFKFY